MRRCRRHGDDGDPGGRRLGDYAGAVTSRPDDDALSWDGDDDPTLDVGSGPDPAPVADPLPAGFTAVGKGSETVSATPAAAPVDVAEDEDRDAPPAAMGNAALVTLGVLAGIYLLLSIAWLLGASRLQLVAGLFLNPVAFQAALWLAVLALPLWFVTTMLLTRGGRSWLRFAVLVAGAVLLVPWPFVLAGAAL